MKKFYNEPEMNISTFSEQDVVTTSGGVEGKESNATDYNAVTAVAQRAAIAYDVLQFNFD